MSWSLIEAMEYYRKQGAPSDQHALIGLLKEIQQEQNGISRGDIEILVRTMSVKEGLLLALIKRIPSLRLKDTLTLEMCAGPNCGKHTALASYAEKLCKDSGRKIELKFVPCMRMCAKGPNVRLNGKVYHGITEDQLKELLNI